MYVQPPPALESVSTEVADTNLLLTSAATVVAGAKFLLNVGRGSPPSAPTAGISIKISFACPGLSPCLLTN